MAQFVKLAGSGLTALRTIDEQTLLQVFEGVPTFEVERAVLAETNILNLCTELCPIFPSKSEMRKLVQGGGVSLNKEKVTSIEQTIGENDLLNGKHLLIQKGKKNYFLIIVK